MDQYTLTNNGVSIKGTFDKEKKIFETTDENNAYKEIEGTYTPGEPAVFDDESGEEVTPAVPATFTVTENNSVWTVTTPQTAGRKRRSSKKSKKGGKKSKKSKKGGKKSKKTRRH